MKQKLSAFVIAGTLLAISILGGSGVSAADTDNFTINTFDVSMDLSRDENGHSTLRTIETITAEFPTTNQNHGLERMMVKKYDGHRTDFDLVSVTDGNGRALPYHWDDDALRIGDKDEYVHGVQTYKITYTQRDVTKAYADTGRDEFYWDAIGVEWRVPIKQASVKVVIAPGLRDRIQGEPRCYIGYQRGTELCQIREFEGTYLMTTEGIGSGRGATIAFGFMPQTFIGYQATFVERFLDVFIKGVVISNVVIGPIALLLGSLVLSLKYRRAKRRYRNVVGATVVPEYLPPKGRSLVEGARIWSPVFFNGGLTGRLISAQLISWAVTHYAEFKETKKKTLFGAAQYTITFKKSLGDLPKLDREMAEIITGSVPKAGDSVTTSQLKKRSKTIFRRMQFLETSLTEGDLYEPAVAFERWAGRLKIACIIFGILLLNIPILILSIILWTAQRQAFVSEAGERLHRYLEGLKMYIGVAEEERLKMLQSPDGAEKVRSVTGDQGVLVKLYERVLPYAILFGQEKEWTRHLGKMYEASQTSPEWVAGTNMYNAAAVTGFVNSFSSSVSSASSYSSSSGGSGGGGYSGGGGGGGGGGGW